MSLSSQGRKNRNYFEIERTILVEQKKEKN
jgi:hypothetical protein